MQVLYCPLSLLTRELLHILMLVVALVSALPTSPAALFLMSFSLRVSATFFAASFQVNTNTNAHLLTANVEGVGEGVFSYMFSFVGGRRNLCPFAFTKFSQIAIKRK